MIPLTDDNSLPFFSDLTPEEQQNHFENATLLDSVLVAKSTVHPRRYSKSNTTHKEFIVVLRSKEKSIHNEFISEMITDSMVMDSIDSGSQTLSAVPLRAVEQSNKNIINGRYTKYFLSDTEAEELKNDPRVLDVEIPIEQLYGPPEIDVLPLQHDTGGFHRRRYPTEQENNSIESHKSWGMIRSISETNPYTAPYIQGQDLTQTQMIIPSNIPGGAGATYSYMYDGTGVDIVIADTGIEADHPEWEDAHGNSRLQQIEWDIPHALVTGYIEYDAAEDSMVLIITEPSGGVEEEYTGFGFWVVVPNKPGSQNYSTNKEYLFMTNYSSESNKLNLFFERSKPTGYYTREQTLLTDEFIEFNPTTLSPEAIDWLRTSRVYKISRVPPSNYFYYSDALGHGTHVASSAAGKIHGYAKNAHIYLINVFLSMDSLTAVLEWHKNKNNGRPTIINCSWHSGKIIIQSNQFGLQNHTIAQGSRIYPEQAGMLDDLNQKCEYSNNNSSSPIQAVVIAGISYDNTNSEAYMFPGVIRPETDESNASVGLSNPILLARLIAAKYGLGKNRLINQISVLNNQGGTYGISSADSPCAVPVGFFQQVVSPQLSSYAIGLDLQRNVVTWGKGTTNYADIVYTVPSDLGKCKSISISLSYHVLAILESGLVRAWGYNYYGQTTIPADLGACTQIAAGLYHSLALKEDGTVRAWGNNDWGQCTVPSDLGACKFISAGYLCSMAIQENGTVVVWGLSAAPPSDLGPCKQALIVDGSDALYLTDAGQVIFHGSSYPGVAMPPDLGICKYIALSKYNAAAVKEDGTVVVWGNNSYGQCTVPSNVSDIVYISIGFLNIITINAFGVCVMWGYSNCKTYTQYIEQITGTYSTALNTLFEEMSDAGIHIVIAAGNDSAILSKENGIGWDDRVIYKYPANTSYINDAVHEDDITLDLYYRRKASPRLDRAINVGSSSHSSKFKGRAIESLSAFSAYGPGVDVYAPGEQIIGACATYSSYGQSGHTYSFSTRKDIENKRFRQIKLSGTSMASPNMAGIAACILQKFPNLTPQQLKDYIVNTSKKGMLHHQDTLDNNFGDTWWQLILPDGVIKQIDNFVTYPYGQKFSLGVSDIQQVGIAYMQVDVPTSILPQRGWYKYTDINGYDQFILLPDLPTTTISAIINKIKTRIARGNDSNWSALEDPDSESLNTTGAHRVQTYLNETTPEE